ncbi:MAG: glucose 1-dehydrogenase [Chloroflexaceae bacterium]|nr:glucose 1-dehydrogenase [Chloroflexaceae bacterium]
MRLANKVAIVTGGASGIGRATALKMAREGAQVVVADLNEAGGNETAALVQAAGGTAIFARTNVAEYVEVAATVELAVQHFGSLDVMFNNAGIGLFKPLLEHEPEDFDRVVKVNQYGVYYGILAAGRKMRDLQTHGVIINTASVFALLASPGVVSYHAAKAAVKMLTQVAALELAPFGIRVVAVAPGTVDTPIIQGYKDAGFDKVMARRQMRGQLLNAEQIANVVAFLASDEADAINGSTVMVDDGYAGFK